MVSVACLHLLKPEEAGNLRWNPWSAPSEGLDPRRAEVFLSFNPLLARIESIPCRMHIIFGVKTSHQQTVHWKRNEQEEEEEDMGQEIERERKRWSNSAIVVTKQS